jgi:hypothetical protein
MDWKILVAAFVAGAICIMIISMIVGTVRSTRGGLDWDHTSDRQFAPWDDDDH